MSFTPSYGYAAMVDVETTGLNPNRDEIIEFAAVLFRFERDTFEIIDIADSYVGLREPRITIPYHVTKIHGLNFSDVKGKSLDTIHIQIILEKAELILAHNAQFDKGFVTRLLPYTINKLWVCTMNGISWKGKGCPSKGLQNLVQYYKIKADKSHRALADVNACIELLKQRDQDGRVFFAELLSPLRMIAATVEQNLKIQKNASE